MPSTKKAIQKGGNVSRKCILLDSLLFRLVTTPKKETALLAIPETCAKKIITLYYSSLFVGHQGVIKIHLTIGDKFFVPGLIHYFKIIYKKGVIFVYCLEMKTSRKTITTENQSIL